MIASRLAATRLRAGIGFQQLSGRRFCSASSSSNQPSSTASSTASSSSSPEPEPVVDTREPPPSLIIGSRETMFQLRSDTHVREWWIERLFHTHLKLLPQIPRYDQFSDYRSYYPVLTRDIIWNKIWRRPLRKLDINKEPLLHRATEIRWGLVYTLLKQPDDSWHVCCFGGDFSKLELSHVELEFGGIRDLATQDNDIYILLRSGKVLQSKGLHPLVQQDNDSPALVLEFKQMRGWTDIQSFVAGHHRLVGLDSQGRVWRQGVPGDPREEAATEEPVHESSLGKSGLKLFSSQFHVGLLTKYKQLWMWGLNYFNRCASRPHLNKNVIGEPEVSWWGPAGSDLPIASAHLADSKTLVVTETGDLWESFYFPFRWLIKANGRMYRDLPGPLQRLMDLMDNYGEQLPFASRQRLVEKARRDLEEEDDDDEAVLNPMEKVKPREQIMVSRFWRFLWRRRPSPKTGEQPMRQGTLVELDEARMEVFEGAASGAGFSVAWTANGSLYVWGDRPDLGITTWYPRRWNLRWAAGTLLHGVKVKRVLPMWHGAVIQLEWLTPEHKQAYREQRDMKRNLAVARKAEIAKAALEAAALKKKLEEELAAQAAADKAAEEAEEAEEAAEKAAGGKGKKPEAKAKPAAEASEAPKEEAEQKEQKEESPKQEEEQPPKQDGKP